MIKRLKITISPPLSDINNKYMKNWLDQKNIVNCKNYESYIVNARGSSYSYEFPQTEIKEINDYLKNKIKLPEKYHGNINFKINLKD